MSDRDDELSRAASEALHAFDEPQPDAVAPAPAGFAETATELGLAATPVQPPASLRADLMARIALTPQLPRLEEGADAATAATPTLAVPAAPAVPTAEKPSEPSGPSQPSHAGPAERRAAARWRRPVGVLVAVAAAAAFFFGGLAIGQLQDSTPSTGQTQAEQLADIAAAPDAQRAAAEVAGGGTATLVWSGELGRSALLADGLAPLPQDQTYQLWYIGAEGPVSAGTFEASSSGTTWHVLEGQMSAGDVVGVTVEPAGGSTEPTSAPIVQIAS
ncbi:anti-sigma factor [Microterricola pindariensis]|uniref:Anti-sigma K factor RskA C-terminal domain-containing protein n=1 Tax=Microterricola pindariensis TaxID=478010 RepID=A0ABX5AQA1_9MICO|nr:anti-sigma factor [Microterricola pindariensis]PPL14197.1 hypothetical protein GY24_16925 [Microterricola pindariensis]